MIYNVVDKTTNICRAYNIWGEGDAEVPQVILVYLSSHYYSVYYLSSILYLINMRNNKNRNL